MIHRFIKLPKKQSFFLFGPRGTGKSTLLKQMHPEQEAIWIDLLDPKTEDLLSRHPEELANRLRAADRKKHWVIIDEVQKVPKLLDVVHSLIENSDLKFALTGSSARKLKRGSANLLAGRAAVHSLLPLTASEIGEPFHLQAALQYGTLPKVYFMEDAEEKNEFLRAYCLTYLKEEIQTEQIVRNLAPFRHFLEVAAQCNGQILNFSKIGRDIGVDTKTVQSYFDILEDTLIGTLLPPYHRSIRKRQRTNPKFYFFDLGVKRALDGTLTVDLLPQTYDYGNAFEHFVILEVMRRSSYSRNDFKFSYLRTKDDMEIDLIVERPAKPTALIEIKSTEQVHEGDISSLAQVQKDFPNSEAFCFSRDAIPKVIRTVRCYPWDQGLVELG